ncbi:hypothetical protein M426DRAFT_244886 [Hypoxylon sp. CI-4A]|nr:hypothetical protein M426DRAFT_244886 [Hypoxylon sp. CI-4A]
MPSHIKPTPLKKNAINLVFFCPSSFKFCMLFCGIIRRRPPAPICNAVITAWRSSWYHVQMYSWIYASSQFVRNLRQAAFEGNSGKRKAKKRKSIEYES